MNLPSAPLFSRFRLAGRNALDYARRHGLALCCHEAEGQESRDDLGPDEAAEIVASDHRLVYLVARRMDVLTYSEDKDHDGVAYAEVVQADGRVFVLSSAGLDELNDPAKNLGPVERTGLAFLWAVNDHNGRWA